MAYIIHNAHRIQQGGLQGRALFMMLMGDFIQNHDWLAMYYFELRQRVLARALQGTTRPSWPTGRRARARRTPCSAPKVGRSLLTSHSRLALPTFSSPPPSVAPSPPAFLPSLTTFSSLLVCVGYTLELAKAGRLPEVVGIIPRAIRDVFTAVRGRPPGDGQVTVFCSFVQIYNEQVRRKGT
jgi:hypothetical protein